MALHLLSNGKLQIRFGDTPLSPLRLKNLLTGSSFSASGTQSVIVRTPLRISDPVFLTKSEWISTTNDSVAFVLTDATGAFQADAGVHVAEEGIRFDVRISGPVALWLVEWRLAGLDLQEVILPALGGQSLSRTMPAGTTLSYKYPFWWNAQFVLGPTAGGGVWLRTREIAPDFKLIRVKRAANLFDLTYGFEATAPLGSTTLDATWFIDCYKGSWKAPVDIHRAWMEEAFGLTRLEDRPGLPEWVREINFVLEIWGIGKEYPDPLHTFDDVIKRLKAWSRLHPPRRTLLYLPGFAEHGIDSRAPDYHPSVHLGGEEKFRNLMDVAHAMGYRVMLHTNVLAMTFDHPLIEQFRQHQVVDLFGREQGWSLDIDGDWLAEPYFAYINPGAVEWGDLMESVIGDLVRSYSLDAVFLDQTLLAFNVSRGRNFVLGMRDHITRLQSAFPGVLFAGEGLHEHVLRPLPMVQIHGIDSIAEIHGMEGKARWRNAHPVSTYLFGPYTRFTAHLLTKHPSHPMFALQESAYAKLGVIPALCLYAKAQPMDLPAVRAMIRRAQRL